MRWPGFRKVRRQVFKRIDRRLKELGISNVSEYRSYLETHSEEWQALDRCCWISISRFYRDKSVFQLLQNTVLPELVAKVIERGESALRCWSIGCAAGEEPYTLALMWKLVIGPRFPSASLSVLATDSDPQAITRSEKACYSPSSLKDLPKEWLEKAFLQTLDGLCLREEYKTVVTFLEQDIRKASPPEQFHLVLCRYLAFTYFDEGLQQDTLRRIKECVLPEGALVIGSLESLPAPADGFEAWSEKHGVYRLTSSRP